MAKCVCFERYCCSCRRWCCCAVMLAQVERHHKTGEKEIDFPDGTRKYILPSGREMSEFPDGVTVVEYPEVYTYIYIYLHIECLVISRIRALAVCRISSSHKILWFEARWDQVYQ